MGARLDAGGAMRATRSMGMLLVTLLAVSLPACGDERSVANTSTTAAAAHRSSAPQLSARAIARRALVRLDDFNADWEISNVRAPDVRCGRTNPYAGARVVSGSKRIVRERTGVQETIAVFANSAASRRAFKRMNSRPAMGCLRRDMRREVSAEAGGQASPLELVLLDRPERWEKATRFASVAPSSLGLVRGSIDAVHLRVGHALGALVIVSGLSGIDGDLYERVTKLFARRLRAAFG
jgi:hypothetical protein